MEREYAEIAAREAAAARPQAKLPVQVQDDGENEADRDFTVVKGPKGLVFAPETVFKNLQLVNDARGKKVSQSYHVFAAF